MLKRLTQAGMPVLLTPRIFARRGDFHLISSSPHLLIRRASPRRPATAGSRFRWRRSRSVLLLLALPVGWDRILQSVGLDLLPPAITLLEGDSALARPSGATVRVAAVEEARDPQLEVIWKEPLVLPVYRLPEHARVFAREKRTGAPLAAGFDREGRKVLWTAAPVGEKGYERFPYLLQALADLGVEFPFRGSRTWAFFDSSYRTRADPEFLAERWRSAGIAALHIAAWHFWEPDSGRDGYLRRLITACHRQGLLAYAWLELPHVSERFWDRHPQWREKTAIGQDAHLDWRKLVNLADPDCAQAVETELASLLERFDWDGVNLAELYFESLYGPDDPQRFTPMNAPVRAQFGRQGGFDPLELFRPDSPRHWSRDTGAWRRFVDYRTALAVALQEHWLATLRRLKPDLDLVLTHIDDRFDPGMREKLGADAARTLPLLERLDFTFVIEDPATLWHLGPERYPEIARRYAPLTARPRRLAVDINIVERYQDVYPTKKQTGTELFQLLRAAGGSFPRVLLYSEQSIAAADLPLLAAASAAVRRAEATATGLVVEAGQTTGVRWKGPALVDGRPWPALDGETVWIPAGRRRIGPGREQPPLRLLHVNLDLLGARSTAGGVEFEYRSSSRAAVLVDRRPARIVIDGAAAAPPVLEGAGHFSVLLPPGRHKTLIQAAP